MLLPNADKLSVEIKTNGSTPMLQNKSVTPTRQSITVTADSGYDGLNQIIVNGDSNLVSENIKLGKIIFGVRGQLQQGEGFAVTTGEVITASSSNPVIGFNANGSKHTISRGQFAEFQFPSATTSSDLLCINWGITEKWGTKETPNFGWFCPKFKADVKIYKGFQNNYINITWTVCYVNFTKQTFYIKLESETDSIENAGIPNCPYCAFVYLNP